MSATSRTLLGALAQLAFLGFAGYLAISESALPESSLVARGGLVALVLVAAYLLGEVSRMRSHMSALINALQSGGAGVAGRDDRSAIDVLVRALSSDDADVRAKAHRNLVRLTGKTFTMDPSAWQAWWSEARDTFEARKSK